MAAAPATKGFTSPISIQGSSTGKVPDFDTYAQFKPMAEVTPVSEGPKTFKFPLDDVSAGNFWTRLIVNSWVPVRPKEELVEKQGHKLTRYHIANIWLPMPSELGTSYKQTFTESDNMMLNRGAGLDVGSISGALDTLWAQTKAIGSAITNELTDKVASIANMNNSGKMNLGSIMNQHMGLVYDGANLRQHTFTWKMIPKSAEEQAKIAQIVFALKSYSAPIIMGPLGGEVNYATAKDALEAKTAEVNNAADAMMIEKYGKVPVRGGGYVGRQKREKQKQILQKLRETPTNPWPNRAGVDFDSMRNIGRLGIPATVKVEFWFGDAINPNLFQIKDSFIESVDVNYTPESGWNAYKDGAPITTEVKITIKENAVISQQDIFSVGGY